MLSNAVSFSLVAFSAIFFVVDPFAVVPVFVSMTEGDSDEKRRAMARKACVLTAAILSFFALGGGVLFNLLGITLAAFKIAGGILLMLTAIDMLRHHPAATRTSPAEIEEGMRKPDIAVVPLAMPLLAGPGSIATVMVLSARSGGWWQLIPIIASIVITAALAYFILRAATRVEAMLGQSGRAILERIMGLMLAAIAVQFVVDGVREAFPSVAPS